MTMALDNAESLGSPGHDDAAAKPGKRTRAPKRKGVPTWRLIDWRVVLAALLVGGLLHIGLVMALPIRHGNGSMQHIKGTLPANRMVIVPAPAPGRQPLAFMVPDAAYALCRFDLSVDSLRVSTALLDQGWVLSLHTSAGDNFYVMPGQTKRTDVAFVLMPGVAALDVGPVPRRFGTSGEVQIPSPSAEGLVVVRAPYKGLAYRAQTEAALAQTVCAPVKR
jgi:uncharacterized membrane protein